MDALFDLEKSVDANEIFLNANGIKTQVDTAGNICGYKLVWGKKEKRIDTVLLDIDLQNELRDFYGVE